MQLPEFHRRDPGELSRIFRYFADVETPRMDSPIYTALSSGVADDADLLAICAQVDPGQPAPNVLFAAVQNFLLQHPAASPEAEALAVFYPAVSRGPIPETSPWPAFRAFCLTHAAELETDLRTGRTQTCVVHRCTSVLPALASIPRIEEAGGRVALLEIGPSAGLNLRLDRYRYDYGHGVGWGAADAQPLLACQTRGAIAPPMPKRLEVVARQGLDLNPIDPDDPNAIRWLRALIWPEHAERARVMNEALAHAASVPIEIVQGDATQDIAREIARLPTMAARIVFATHVFYQIPPEGRRRIHDEIAHASREAPVDLILMESSGEGDSRVSWFPFEDGEARPRTDLARSDSHGRWIDWGAR